MGNCHVRENFYSAVQQGDLKEMSNLIHRVKDVNYVLKDTGSGPLHISCIMGKLDVVKFLLEHGADLDLPDAQGRRALYIASMSGQLDIVRLFLDKSVSIHTKSNDGLTAFYVAAWRGHLEIVKLLVECGTDLHVKDKEGRTAWDAAWEWDHNDVVQYLIDLRRSRGEEAADMPPRPTKPKESDAADKVFVDVSDDENEEGWTSVNVDEAETKKP